MDKGFTRLTIGWDWNITPNTHSIVADGDDGRPYIDVSFHSPGSYTIGFTQYMVGDTPGEPVPPFYKTVTVLPAPWISSPGSSVQSGQIVTFTAMLSEPAYDWQWELDGGGSYYYPSGGNQNPNTVYVIAESGTISIRCRALLLNSMYTGWAYANVDVYDYAPAPAPASVPNENEMKIE